MRGLSQIVRTVIGVILIILAVVTGPIPVIQGWVFFLAAIAVLGRDHPIIKWCFRLIEWAKQLALRLRIIKWCVKQIESAKQWALRFWKKKNPEPKV